ncbi:MAG: histidinol-phosphatase HisJ family protein [Oscillospiraceae bacterium]|nr:histidinol-phosphatase HisJ family protein [Oscillospiraceae bacterium]
MQLLDCHTHTELSPDSSAKFIDMYQQAKNLNLYAWSVTNHIELCRYYSQEFYATQPRNEEDFFNYALRWENSMQENQFAKELISSENNMQFINGIELGEPNADFGLAKSLYQDKRLDFVIASLHELPDKLDFYFLDYAQENISDLLENYFNILLEITKHDCYDVLGHITYPLRYIAGKFHIKINMQVYQDYIAEIFKSVINNQKGIELNTSGYRQSYGKPFPDENLLKFYKALGGKILTLGSDAHSPEDLGKGVQTGIALANACGFDKVCYYLRHEAHFININ